MNKLFSWNVNGLRAARKKGFLDWLASEKPYAIGLQETKCHPDQLDDELRDPPGYHTYWASAERKGYSGVALYSREEPVSVQIGLGISEFDAEGRTIVADYGEYVLITAYFPNGNRDHKRVPFKMEYKREFLEFCNNLRDEGHSVIFCGDVNTAHKEIDLARPKQNKKTTGFLPLEREWIDEVVELGYVDTFRELHPDQIGAYTWWSYIGGARNRNVGWRIDYFFATPDIMPHILSADIHPEIFGSDHCPVSLTLETEN
jgi:exodeoxyribonuclease-3